tara:strand:- start:1515 stop:1712 length:198 start_codon:yes stop_codon:yes gene_type:complete
MREDDKVELSINEDRVGGLDRSSRVDLNYLMRKVKEEEKKTKRNNVVLSAAAVSAVAVFGIIMTL